MLVEVTRPYTYLECTASSEHPICECLINNSLFLTFKSTNIIPEDQIFILQKF
ncbi:hypothetical protein EBI_26941 [Enterocytozoon bieneusi H348]|nr:hypothetical protein EBI_26941 [Enterocytozoon bieneusi H348]|eukprot:XP_002651645.1 hypothetical protein EBI_26941 [Enterocytozoon bieneusi H348]